MNSKNTSNEAKVITEVKKTFNVKRSMFVVEDKQIFGFQDTEDENAIP
jgi:hypothetical protein